MSREAFEAWQKSIGRHPSQEKDRIARDYLLSIDHRIYAAWQAARAAALEKAAQACESEAELWQEGVEARLCAARIRALKEKE
jgi:hypothetical protein